MIFCFSRKGMYKHDTSIFVSLIQRTETAKYLLSGVIRDRLVVLLFQLSDVKCTFVFLAKERNLILLFFFYNVNICNMILLFLS